MSISITVTGNSEVAQAIAQRAQALTSRQLLLAGVSGALLIVNDAKRNAPVKTGTLRRSIHVGGFAGESGAAFGGGASDIGGAEHDESGFQLRVGTNLLYARMVEQGTSRMAARPYLRTAMDSQRGACIREVANAIRALLASGGAA